MSEVMDVAAVAKMLGVRKNTIRQWRHRYEDFPEPTLGTNLEYPWYSTQEIIQWYLRQWPERAASWQVRLHRYYVNSTDGLRELSTVDFGPVSEARGYLKAIRDLQYRDWRTWHTSEGLVAERGNDIHIWYLDPTGGDPEEWFVYQSRIKGGAK